MSKPTNPRFNAGGNDFLVGLIDGVAKLLLTLGGLAALIGIIFLIVNYFSGGTLQGEALTDAQSLQRIWQQLALFGSLAVSIGAAWLLWEEETAGPIMMLVGIGLFLCNLWLPLTGAVASPNDLTNNAVTYLSYAGAPLALAGMFMTGFELLSRMRMRAVQGSKAENMKYGKGIKEEKDVRNVLLGKCWQLPYCRKFVRERCPIYHARRTCWKERVGCMCEESVIKNAMEGKVIATDIVAAAKFIPQNNKLTPNQKAERCRQCVIYNEHQKHKYKVTVPAVSAAIVGLYLVLRPSMTRMINESLLGISSTVDRATGSSTGATSTLSADGGRTTAIEGGVIPYSEIIFVVLALVLFAYAIKMIEYFYFKLKV